jgi:hypothetical protein
MSKNRVAVLLAVVACICVAALPSVAQGREWHQFLNHYHLLSGTTGYGPETEAWYVYGGSEGHAATCVGITGLGVACGEENQSLEVYVGGWIGRPEVHDHSTYETYVFGYYYE